MAKDNPMLTTPQVADRLGVSVRRVQALIKAGRLPSQQFGRDHLIRESDLKLVENRKAGRPAKQASDKVSGRTKSKGATTSDDSRS